MRRLFIRNASGAAAVEMALVAPLLITLMFGSMELGYYFYSEHVVIKAVRDGARFATRQSFSRFTCPNTIDPNLVLDTQRLTRTNQISGGTARLAGWTSDASVTVSLSCVSNASNTYGSFYTGYANVPVITVSATVPYTSLFKVIGFPSVGLSMSSQSQAAVMGQ